MIDELDLETRLAEQYLEYAIDRMVLRAIPEETVLTSQNPSYAVIDHIWSDIYNDTLALKDRLPVGVNRLDAVWEDGIPGAIRDDFAEMLRQRLRVVVDTFNIRNLLLIVEQ